MVGLPSYREDAPAPPLPATMERPCPTIFRWRIPPYQPIAADEDDAAEKTRRSTIRFRETRLRTHHLLVRQPVNLSSFRRLFANPNRSHHIKSAGADPKGRKSEFTPNCQSSTNDTADLAALAHSPRSPEDVTARRRGPVRWGGDGAESSPAVPLRCRSVR